MVNVLNRDKALISLREFTDQKAGIRRLLSLPSLQLHVLRACNDPQKTPEQIANLVKYDPTLIAKTLYLSPSEHNSTEIRERIHTTPRSSIKQLILSGCAERYALYQEARQEVFDSLKQQWVMSLQTAFLARSFAYQFGYTKPDQAYYAGLLHNIGQLLFQSEDIDDYFLLQQNAGDDIELVEQERSQYGFDHTLLGAYLAKQWGLDTSIQDAIRYHHTPIDKIQDAHPLTRIVYLSRCIAEQPFSSFKELILFTRRIFKVEHDELIPLVESALTQTGDVIQALNINIPNRLVSQTLVPFLPEDQAHSQLQETAKSHQLMRDIHVCGVVDSVDISLSQASTEIDLQNLVNHSAKALYGTTRCLFFKFAPQTQTLHGSNLVSPDCVSNEIMVHLNNEHSELAKSFRTNQLCETFNADYDSLSVIDREIIDHTVSNAMVCAPIPDPQHPYEDDKLWGVLVFGFDTDTEFQISTIQASIRYFAHSIANHLARIETLQNTIDQVQQTEKGLYTATLKRMVHEINNPLSIAQNNIHVLGVKNRDNSELTNSLLNIQEEITRAADLLKQHLDVNTKEEIEQRPVIINELSSDLMMVFKDAFLDTKQIDYDLELDQTIPPVYIDESSLKQILTNLVKNAWESMDEGGWLALKSFDQVIINDKEYVEIQVEDDGPGVPKTVLEKLFSPIDSQKGAGHAGLGLSIVKELAQSLGGFVSYRRTQGDHTVFSVFFPRVTRPPEHH
ncbi:MAG: HDOD domain-containing protein [Pseudomonadales bacterium]|nr:HDOD domain-containing protein [Pseudomonadales bacterium]